MIFRRAEATDINEIWNIICQAKEQMKQLGTFQWDADYPLIEDIEMDISNRDAYVISIDDKIVVYGAIVFSGESIYSSIEGEWLSNSDYAVIHRLATSDKYKHCGLATKFMRMSERVVVANNIFSIKVDTKYDNIYMKKIFKTLGYKYCGLITYERGEREE